MSQDNTLWYERQSAMRYCGLVIALTPLIYGWPIFALVVIPIGLLLPFILRNTFRSDPTIKHWYYLSFVGLLLAIVNSKYQFWVASKFQPEFLIVIVLGASFITLFLFAFSSKNHLQH